MPILENKGLIFDIRNFEPFANFTHAQSPQLVRLGGINRIYFSSRPKKGSDELPTTEVLFVDFDSKFKEILDFSRSPVLSSAILGAYDEHGIFPFHVAELHGQIFGYICGWSRRVSVPVETSIGISESKDGGKTFQRLGNGPILTSSLQEPFLVGDPFVISKSNKHFMYYIAGTAWKYTDHELELQRVYKIRMAVSTDGINWVPSFKNIVKDVLDLDECQALPSILPLESTSIMAFCFREMSNFRSNGKGAYQLGFATSSDLISWQRNDNLYSIQHHHSEWDSGMRCYPNINSIDGRIFMFYNGNDFGKNGFGLAVEE
jgi:hypothetical protein